MRCHGVRIGVDCVASFAAPLRQQHFSILWFHRRFADQQVKSRSLGLDNQNMSNFEDLLGERVRPDKSCTLFICQGKAECICGMGQLRIYYHALEICRQRSLIFSNWYLKPQTYSGPHIVDGTIYLLGVSFLPPRLCVVSPGLSTAES